MNPVSARRIAIVGFGPRGIGALERLMAHHSTTAADPIEVTIFEPHPTPGVGSGYDPELAPFFLMNFPASKIDLGWRSEGPPPNVELPSFREWAACGIERAEHWYPPRALVGRYLSAVAKTLFDSAQFPVRLVAQRVNGVEASSSGWLVETVTEAIEFDEVLLTIGHAQPGSSASRSFTLSAKDQVDIRGFGLTAIDLILDLTEGRGGRFVPTGDHGLQYIGAPDGPSLIVPHSRHGRPMLVKPELSRSPVPAETAQVLIDEGRELLVALPPGSGITQLVPTISFLAGGLLGSAAEAAGAEAWLDSAISGELDSAVDPAEANATSLRITHGETQPGIEWALGLAWRSIYPTLVERFSHGGLPKRDAPQFRLLAAELERLAFGPPPVNGAKLMALVEAGVLDLSELDQPALPQSRIQIDAVSEPPGLRPDQGPIPSLVAQGAVRVPDGLRGIEVTRAARCVGSGGETTEGLAACGRLTEDWVIGNDTLDRSLHPEINRWAAEVCGAVRAEAAFAVAT